MPCVKTGAHIYLQSYGLYAYGDAFKVGEAFILKLAAPPDFKVFRSHVHYRVDSNPEQLTSSGHGIHGLGRGDLLIVPWDQVEETVDGG